MQPFRSIRSVVLLGSYSQFCNCVIGAPYSFLRPHHRISALLPLFRTSKFVSCQSNRKKKSLFFIPKIREDLFRIDFPFSPFLYLYYTIIFNRLSRSFFYLVLKKFLSVNLFFFSLLEQLYYTII